MESFSNVIPCINFATKKFQIKKNTAPETGSIFSIYQCVGTSFVFAA
jgi:hypothetical protein